MKKLSFLLILTFLATSIFAQKSAEDRAAKATAKMTENLNLTAEQQVQIEKIYLEKYSQKMALKSAAKADKAVRKAEQKQMKADFNTQIEAVLTDDQLAKRAELKAERKEKKGEKKALKAQRKAERKANKGSTKGKMGKMKGMTADQVEARAERATTNMTKRLDLTPEQQTQVHAAYVDYYQKNADLNSRSTASADRKALRAERKDLHEAFRTNLDSLLTEEQKAKRVRKREHKMNKKAQN